MASSIALTFHGLRHDSDMPDRQFEPAARRYVVCSQRFAAMLDHVPSGACCRASEFPGKPVGEWTILTFDDGLISDFEIAFPALGARNLRGTFFVTANNVGRSGYANTVQLREMSAAGMEIASHGLTHRYLVPMFRREAIREIRESKARIEQDLGSEVASFAPVGGHFEKWMFQEAAEAGYRVFATMVPGRTKQRTGLAMLRRNHIQAHHGVEHMLRVLAGSRPTLLANRLRYSLLKAPKTLLGIRNYDRIKRGLLSVRSA